VIASLSTWAAAHTTETEVTYGALIVTAFAFAWGVALLREAVAK